MSRKTLSNSKRSLRSSSAGLQGKNSHLSSLNRQKTINDLYEQLAHLVDCVSENRHIETMEAFHICNRMLTEGLWLMDEG